MPRKGHVAPPSYSVRARRSPLQRASGMVLFMAPHPRCLTAATGTDSGLTQSQLPNPKSRAAAPSGRHPPLPHLQACMSPRSNFNREAAPSGRRPGHLERVEGAESAAWRSGSRRRETNRGGRRQPRLLQAAVRCGSSQQPL